MKQNSFGISGLTNEDCSYHLDDCGLFSWTAKTVKEYESIEKKIEKIGVSTKAFDVYAWCDISGFDYWVNRQEEPNYIQISVSLKKKSLTKKDIEKLREALDDAKAKAEDIEINCSNDVAELYTQNRKLQTKESIK